MVDLQVVQRFKDEAARWHEEHSTVGQDVGFMCSDKYFVIFFFVCNKLHCHSYFYLMFVCSL